MASQLDFRVKNGLVVQTTATFVSTAQAVSTASGAVQIIGGAGIGGNLWVGGTVNVAGTINASVTGVITSATNIANGTAGQIPYQSAAGVTTFAGPGTAGQVLVSRGASASGPTFQNTLTLAGSTAATSTTTGALVVTGGVGVGQNLYVNNNTVLGTNYNNTATGSKITLRGILQTATVSSIVDTTLNVALALPMNNWSIVSTDGNFVRNVLSKDSSNNVTVGVSGSSFHNDVNIYTGPSGAFNIYSGTGQIRSHFDNQGVLRISTTTVATSTITGALQVAGGVGVGGSAYFGNDLYLTKPTNNYVYLINSNTVGNYNNEIYFKTTNAYSNIGNQSGVGTIAVLDNSDSSKGSIRFFKNGSFTDLGIFASGFGSTSTANLLVRLDQSQFTTDLIVKSSTNAVSTTTGAFQVAGGIGVGGNIVIGGNSTVTNNEVILGTTAVSSTITGALQVRGGVGVGGSVFVGGVVTATNFFAGPWAVSTGTSLAVQWVGSALGTVDTLNFATGTTATVVGRTVTIQAVSQVSTVAQPAAANYFPVFVDSNNTTTSGEILYTTGSFSINPGTGEITVGSTVTSAGFVTPAGAANRPGAHYDIATGQYLHAGQGVNIGGEAGGKLIFGDTFTPSVLEGNPSTIFAYVNNNIAGNQLWYGTSAGLVVGNGVSPLATLDVRGTAIVSSTTNATSTNTGALQVQGGVGIGGSLVVGGTVTATNFVGNLTGIATTASFALLATTASFALVATTSTNLAGGNVGSLPYQSTASSTVFLPLGTVGFILTAGATGPQWSNAESLGITTATNIAGGSAGQLLFQSTGGITAFAGPGTAGQLLVSAGASATGPVYTGTASIYVGRATLTDAVVGAGTGNILIQSANNTTSFLSTGTAGQLLMSAGGAPVFINTASVYVGSAVTVDTVRQTTDQNYYPTMVGTLNAARSANFVFTTSSFRINAASGLMSLSGRLAVNNTDSSTGTNTDNSLYVGGGAWIDKNLTVSGDTTFRGSVVFNGTNTFVYSSSTVYTDNLISLHAPGGSGPGNHTWTIDDGKDIGFMFHYYKTTDKDAFLGFNNATSFLEWYDNGTESGGVFTGTSFGTFRTGAVKLVGGTQNTGNTSTGDLTVLGGVGITGNVYIQGSLNVIGGGSTNIVGIISTATSIAGGSNGQLVYQVSPGVTGFVGPGTAGELLFSGGTGIPVYNSTASTYVGNAVVSTNLRSGTPFQIPYQSSANTTAFASSGTTGRFWQATTNGAPTWTTTANIYVANAAIATNLRSGTPFQIPYQSSANTTAFANSGTTGQFWQAATNGAPTWTTTANMYVSAAANAASLFGGVGGSIPYQSAANTTTFLGIGTNGFVLTSNGSAPVWQALSGLTSGSATTATNLAGGNAWQIPYQTAPGNTAFASSGTVGQFWQAATNGAPTWTTTANMYVANAVVSTNLRGGTIGQLHVQTAADTSGFVGPGTAGQLLVSAGAASPVYTNTASIYVGRAVLADSATTALTANLATTATNLAAGVAGSLPYQSGTGTTTFLGIGTNGFILASNGSAPIWQAISGLSAGSATTATNLAGGNAWQIPYQTAPGATAFANSGTTGQFWQATTNGAPTWTTTANMYVANAVIATNVRGGTIGQLAVQTAANATGFVGPGTAGQLLVSAGAASPVYTNTASIYVGRAVLADSATTALTANLATTATNLAAGVAGSLPYQSSAGITTFLGIGTNGFVLTSNGSAPIWQAISGLSAGSATTATNLAGGNAWQIPYQTAPGATAFANSGTTGQFWQATTNGAPTWTTTANMYVANAAIATNLRGGTIGQLAVQTAANTSGFVGPGTAGQLLVSAGAASPVYTNTSSIYVQNAVVSTNLRGGTAMSVPYQSSAGTTAFVAAGTTGQVLQTNGTGSAPTWVTVSGLGAGSATTATQVNTVAQTGNASYFLTFVDSNNASATGELVYTTSSFTINPATRAVAVGGALSTVGSADLATGLSGDVVQIGAASSRVIVSAGGGNIHIRSEAGDFNLRAATALLGGLTIAAAGGTVTINTNSNAISTTTGALRVVGGVGIGGTLMVNERITIGTTSTSNKFEVAGTAGQLFSVADTFTGTIFSANDVSGIPSIEVLDTGLVKLAQYNGQVTISTGTAVSGSGLAVWTSTYILSLGVGTSGSGTIGEIRATNEVTAYYSDRRLKENVQVIDNAVTKVLSLTGITYTPNAIAESYGYDRTKKLVGVFADEIEAVLPEAVRPAPFDVDDSGNSKSGENYKTVQYEKIVPLLIEAIKEQQKSIENLQKEIAQLKSQI